MTLPGYNLRKTGPADRARLDAWLNERALDLALRDEGDADPTLVRRRSIRYDTPETGDRTRPGDVRILTPVAPASGIPGGPVYVLLVETEPGLRAVPFGRYATPAVPGEAASGLRAPPLRVLCFWNIRDLAPEHLLPGRVAEVSPAGLARIRAMVDAVRRGSVVSGRGTRFGPPLVHPADPRYAYLDEERRRLDAHVAGPESLASPQTPPPLRLMEGGRTRRADWLMAAEGRPGYGRDEDG